MLGIKDISFLMTETTTVESELVIFKENLIVLDQCSVFIQSAADVYLIMKKHNDLSKASSKQVTKFL